MEFEKLPNDNDVIIMGTGMVESVVSAASSRIELNVLNIDKNDYYGGCWGSFSLNGFKEFLTSQTDNYTFENVISNGILGDNEKFIPLMRPKNFIKNIQECDYPSRRTNEASIESLNDVAELKITTDSDEKSGNEDSTEEAILKKEDSRYDDLYDEMIKKQRHFVLDLLPKMMYSRGSIIELLISSDVARYCEFKLVTRILTIIKDKFESVPSSRSEVFSTTSVNVIDKRMLMKFLTFALEFEKHEDELKDREKMTFIELLEEKKLSPVVRHYIQHAIAMVPQDASVIEGLKSTKKYLSSLGRYGNSALLSPLYGTGELLQCFCRMSAVFGGVYCLRRTLSGVIVEGNKIVGVIDSQGQRLNTKWFLLESSYASQFVDGNELKTTSISRAILITDKSVHPDKEKHLSLANIPSPTNPGSHIIMQELPPSSRACPENFNVVHLACKGTDAKSDLSPFVGSHFNNPSSSNYEMNDDKPNIMWMVFFNIESVCETKTSYENLILIPGPVHELDCDSSISMAETIFKQMFPDKEFLPRAPSPEEIVFHCAPEENGQTEGEVDEMKEEITIEAN